MKYPSTRVPHGRGAGTCFTLRCAIGLRVSAATKKEPRWLGDASELVDLFRSVLPDSTAEETERWLGSADVVSGTHVVWACCVLYALVRSNLNHTYDGRNSLTR